VVKTNNDFVDHVRNNHLDVPDLDVDVLSKMESRLLVETSLKVEPER